MSKNCPKCGFEVPEDGKFCGNCGYSFEGTVSSGNSNILKNKNIFLILIAVVVIIGVVFLIASGLGGNNDSTGTVDDVEHVYLTISDVGGWDSDSSEKNSYTLYTNALFTGVPSDIRGYMIKTTYFDGNDTQIGHETEKLENVYYESNYAIGFGYYTTYTLPNPDHVKVEIIKDNEVIDTYTEQIDKNKIDFLN